ncbi:hypothetical protein ACF0H5_007245 [Mactra antiquata]
MTVHILIFVLQIAGLRVVAGIEFNYIGCFNYSDEWETRANVSNITVDSCHQYCVSSYRYIYIGVGTNECYCDTEIKGEKLNATECEVPCNDTNSNSTCDGYDRISVYRISDSKWLDTMIMCLSLSLSGWFLINGLICVILVTRYYKNKSRAIKFTKTLSRSFYLKNDTATIEENFNRENDIIEDEVDNIIAGAEATPLSDINEKHVYDRLKTTGSVPKLDSEYSYVDNDQLSGTSHSKDDSYIHCQSQCDEGGDVIQPYPLEEHALAQQRRKKGGRTPHGRRKLSNRISTFYDRIKINVLNKGSRRVELKYYRDDAEYDRANHEHIQMRRAPQLDTFQPTLDDSIEVKIKSQRTNTYDEVELL